MKNIESFDLFEMSKVNYNEKLKEFFLCFEDIKNLLYKEFKKDADDTFSGGHYHKNNIEDYLEDEIMPTSGILFYFFNLPPHLNGAQLTLFIDNSYLKIGMWYSDKNMNTKSVWILKVPIYQIDGKEQIFLDKLVESIKNRI